MTSKDPEILKRIGVSLAGHCSNILFNLLFASMCRIFVQRVLYLCTHMCTCLYKGTLCKGNVICTNAPFVQVCIDTCTTGAFVQAALPAQRVPFYRCVNTLVQMERTNSSWRPPGQFNRRAQTQVMCCLPSCVPL